MKGGEDGEVCLDSARCGIISLEISVIFKRVSDCNVNSKNKKVVHYTAASLHTVVFPLKQFVVSLEGFPRRIPGGRHRQYRCYEY